MDSLLDHLKSNQTMSNKFCSSTRNLRVLQSIRLSLDSKLWLMHKLVPQYLLNREGKEMKRACWFTKNVGYLFFYLLFSINKTYRFIKKKNHLETRQFTSRDRSHHIEELLIKKRIVRLKPKNYILLTWHTC